jgi:glutathione S-transferase
MAAAAVKRIYNFYQRGSNENNLKGKKIPFWPRYYRYLFFQELNDFLVDKVYLVGHRFSLADILLYYGMHRIMVSRIPLPRRPKKGSNHLDFPSDLFSWFIPNPIFCGDFIEF